MHRRRAGVAAIKQKNLAQVLKAAITLNKDDFLQSTCSIVLCNGRVDSGVPKDQFYCGGNFRRNNALNLLEWWKT